MVKNFLPPEANKWMCLLDTCKNIEDIKEKEKLFNKCLYNLTKAYVEKVITRGAWESTLRSMRNISRAYGMTVQRFNFYFSCVLISFNITIVDHKIDVGIVNIPHANILYLILRRYEKCAKQGNRAVMLYGCVRDMIKVSKDLDKITIDNFLIDLKDLALESGLSLDRIRTICKSSMKEDILLEDDKNINHFNDNSYTKDIILSNLCINENPRLVKIYTPVFSNGSRLPRDKTTLTYEEAIVYPGSICVAEELQHSNRIVIDCDSLETVKLFKDYIELTESYISEDRDKAHLVFITDRLIPTKHRVKLDLLGNLKCQIRKIKPNKQYNGIKVPMKLTQEIIDIFNRAS